MSFSKRSLFALCAVAALALCTSATVSVRCVDEDGKSVDHWLIYKLPRLHGVPAADGGFGYAYWDPSHKLAVSDNALNSTSKGALRRTLTTIPSGKDVGVILYNDEKPADVYGEHSHSHSLHQHVEVSASSGGGHTKGVVAFTTSGGFWLTHSVPRYPTMSSSNRISTAFPEDEKDYGQTFMCVHFSLKELDALGAQLRVNQPHVYHANVPRSMESTVPNLVAVANGNFSRHEPHGVSTTLTSVGGTEFKSFAKNDKWGQDLYEDLVEPTLEQSMQWETWVRGDVMPSFCKPKYRYDSVNIKQVALDDDISWDETKDHAKWGVSLKSSGGDYVCVSDINRMTSQRKRGGGCLCLANQALWADMSGLVDQADSC